MPTKEIGILVTEDKITRLSNEDGGSIDFFDKILFEMECDGVLDSLNEIGLVSEDDEIILVFSKMPSLMNLVSLIKPFDAVVLINGEMHPLKFSQSIRS